MEIELRQVFRATVRWAWLIALSTVLAGLLAFVLTKGQTATYSATTTLLVNPQQVTSMTDNNALQASRSQAETYVRLVESGPVLDQVRKELDLPLTRAELEAKIDATTILNTQLIQISVKDASAEQAATIANTVAKAFEARVNDLTTGRLEENLEQATNESTALRDRVTVINAELLALDVDANKDDSAIQGQISALKEERNRAQETIADLDSTIRTINASLATTTSPVEIADEARAARQPDSPKPALMTVLGLFLGFLIGCGLAAVLEVSDRKVRTETDIESLTETRLLAIVPVNRKKSAEQPAILTAPDSPEAEAVRLLRTHLQGSVRAQAHESLSLAHVGSGAHGANLLANLAIAFAQSGTSTMLVDANFRSPYLHTVFHKQNAEGLGQVVAGSSVTSVDTLVVPDLRMIAAGSVTDHPATVVSSSAFAKTLRDISQQADLTLVGTPPAIAYSDALSVTAVTDGVLISARYGETNRDDLAALASTLREDGRTVVGIVMIR